MEDKMEKMALAPEIWRVFQKDLLVISLLAGQHSIGGLPPPGSNFSRPSKDDEAEQVG